MRSYKFKLIFPLYRFENYRNPTIAIGITMFRTFVLGFVAIATLLAYILKDIDKIVNFLNLKSTCFYTEFF